MKLDWSAIWESVVKNKIVFIVIGLVIVLGITALWMTDCGSNWAFNRGQSKLAANANAAIEQAANVKKDEANLQLTKAGVNANLNNAIEDMQQNVYGREEAKKEVNAALANYNKALASNTNVDVTAEQLKAAVERLNQ